MLSSLSKEIHKRRIQLGLTIEDLANKSHLSESTISKIEGNRLTDISIASLQKIAAAFNVPLSELLGVPQLTDDASNKLFKWLLKLPDERRQEVSTILLKLFTTLE